MRMSEDLSLADRTLLLYEDSQLEELENMGLDRDKYVDHFLKNVGKHSTIYKIFN